MTAMVCHVELFETIDSVADVWDRISPVEDVYQSLSWMRTVNHVVTPNTAFLVAFADDAPVAGLAAHLVSPESFPYYNPPRLLTDPQMLEEFLEVATDEEARDLRQEVAAASFLLTDAYPAAVCVAPFGYTTSLSGPGLRRKDICDALLERFDELSTHWSAKCRAFLYVPDLARTETAVTALLDRGYAARALDVTCGIRIRWSSIDAYLAELSSSRRSQVRAERKLFTESGLRITPVPIDALWDSTMFERFAYLSAKLQEKYGLGFDVEMERVALDRIRKNMTKYARLDLIVASDEIIGFSLAYDLGPKLQSAMAVLDKAAGASSTGAYFNILYHLLEVAIAKGHDELDLGSGAIEAKVLRGASPGILNGFFQLASGDAFPQRLMEMEDRLVRRLADRYAERRALAD
jgi:predicted N-acyltransferase